MRTGGRGGMFFAIDRARFLTRQTLGGARRAALVRAVSPAIEGKLVYLCKGGRGCQPTAVRAGRRDTEPRRRGGCRPRRASRPLDRLAGRLGVRRAFADSSSTTSSTGSTFPPRPIRRWAEWQYFNVVTGPDEWWYVTYLVGGEVPAGRWGGRMLVTHRRPDGEYERFTADVPARPGMFDTDARRPRHRPEPRSPAGRGVHAPCRGPRRGGRGASIELDVRPVPIATSRAVELRDDELALRLRRSRARRLGERHDLRRGPMSPPCRRRRLSRPQLGCLAGRDLGVGRRAREPARASSTAGSTAERARARRSSSRSSTPSVFARSSASTRSTTEASSPSPACLVCRPRAA